MNFWPFSRKKRGGQAVIYHTSSFPFATQVNGSADLESRLGTLEEKIDSVKPHDPQKLNDESRAQIAKFFVHAFVWLIVLVLVFIPLYNWLALDKPQPIEIDKTLAQVGGILGTPLGFIVGYYFEKGNDRRR